MRILTYITTEKDAGRAARSVVPRRFQLGTHAFRRLKVEGGILCDGKPLRADTVLRAGQLLEVRMDNGGVQAAPADSGLDGLPPSFIRYIDEDMIVVSKGRAAGYAPLRPHPHRHAPRTGLPSCSVRTRRRLIITPSTGLDKGTTACSASPAMPTPSAC